MPRSAFRLPLRFDRDAYRYALGKWQLRHVVAARDPDAVLLRILPTSKPRAWRFIVRT